MTEKKQAKSSKLEAPELINNETKPSESSSCKKNKSSSRRFIIVILVIFFAYLSMPLWYESLPSSLKCQALPKYFLDFSKLSIDNRKQIQDIKNLQTYLQRQASKNQPDVSLFSSQIKDIARISAENSREILNIKQNDTALKKVEELTILTQELQKQLNELKEQSLNADVLENLNERILIAESKIAGLLPNDNSELKLIAAISLREKLNQGSPYAKELNELETFFKDDEVFLSKIAFLKQEAGKGISSSLNLSYKFKSLAPLIVSASKIQDNNENWKTKSLQALSKIFLIRKTNSSSEMPLGNVETTEDFVNKAEKLLEKQDLTGAIKTLGQISNERALMVFDNWLVDASLRIKAEDFLSSLILDLINKIKQNSKE